MRMNSIARCCLSASLNGFFVSLLLGVVPQGACAGWQPALRLDSTNGAYPSISWSPQGDARVFYGIQGTPERMVSRKRPSAAMDFGPETFVYNDGRAVAIHYDAGGSLDLAVANVARVVVLKSTDGGDSWEFQQSYTGRSSAAVTCYLPPAFTEDGTDLRLVYGYRYSDPIFGPRPEVYSARRTDGTWGASGTRLGTGEIGGAREEGDAVCVVTSLGALQSSNNGASFTLLGGSGAVPDQLYASDMALGDNHRIFLLHSYAYGPVGQDQHLTFSFSDDVGASWRSPQLPIVSGASDPMYGPRFTVDGQRMIVVWQHADAPNEHRQIRCIISNDGGQTWGSVATIVDLAANETLDPNGTLDIASHEGRTALVYAVRKDGLRDRVCFMEWVSDPGADSDRDGLPDAVETDTGVYVSPSDTGTDPTNADTDSDGMPDGWEVAHGLHPLINDALGDPDQDHFANLSEYVAGTDPHQAADLLRVSVCDPGTAATGPVICWDSRAGRTYRVYANTDLNVPWPPSFVHEVAGDGTTKAYTNSTAGSPRYFRVEVAISP